MFPVRRRYTVPLAHGGRLSVGDRTLVMGVINVTPDSFSDGGRLFDPAQAIEAGVRMVDEGADLIDVGGESTRPAPIRSTRPRNGGACVPVIEGLAGARRPNLRRYISGSDGRGCARRGRSASSTTSAGCGTTLHWRTSLRTRGAAIVLMHTRGRSREMYQQASYHDVVDEVLDELRESIAFATAAGIQSDHLIVDPGLGFAKEAVHSYEVLAGLSEFAELGRPLLVGPSRKSFLAKPLGGSVPPRGARLGHCRGSHGCGAGRRPHRARARRARDAAGGARGGRNSAVSSRHDDLAD